ncbi:phosphate ABC transporter substrate-binding protein PstS [Massilia atriviolacea]|uniref:Phosphate-binding protein PstS n=1 Tax=Massilia atriviolacea TaxID=2495579 RepID=A0A430HTM5_9BURK|nr:phosphate ABC transporter substrate-binding protein PstS [Massilia atriviolacea]RSZ60839.1 phosphate ABC transporter substrate-binding protein PstS [Massilia atriviolacea]
MFSVAKTTVTLSLLLSAFSANAVDISGAGSSAAQPLYVKLADVYGKSQNLKLSYQANGSSEGIKQVKAKTVEFGATDIAPSQADLKAGKMICFPSAVSGVVPVVNLPGLKRGDVQLTGELLADIFSRKITKWNDPKLTAANPGVALPDLAIAVIARQDGSGTTYNFSDYLSKVSPAWKQAYGRNFTVAWANGVTQVNGSNGAVSALKQTPGAIAYVDYQYVVQDKLAYTRLKNRDGKVVAPGAESFTAALLNSPWVSQAKYEEMLTDRVGPTTWPITSGTFIVASQATNNPEKTIATLKFFAWGFAHGDSIVGNANFVRLPDTMQGRIFGDLTTITDSSGKPLKWSLAEALDLR